MRRESKEKRKINSGVKADPARRMSRPLAALGGHNQSRHLHPFSVNHAVRWSCKSVVVRRWRIWGRWECTFGAHSHRGEEPLDAGRLEWRPSPWRMLIGLQRVIPRWCPRRQPAHSKPVEASVFRYGRKGNGAGSGRSRTSG